MNYFCNFSLNISVTETTESEIMEKGQGQQVYIHWEGSSISLTHFQNSKLGGWKVKSDAVGITPLIPALRQRLPCC